MPTPHPEIDFAQEEDAPKLRQVQVSGRRHGISIEPIYWRILEEASRESDMRLNRLVGCIAAAAEGPHNLAARLRLFCVKFLDRHRQELARFQQNVNIQQIVNAVPAPCFSLSSKIEITSCNRLFGDWANIAPVQLIGFPLDRHFNMKLSRPLAEVWQGFATGAPETESGVLTCFTPGRLLVRAVSVSPIFLPVPKSFSCLVFLK